jgi:hypothetical protein
MTVAHYGYLFLKMPSPNDVLKIHGDCDAGISALEKLQALAARHNVAARPGSSDQTPSSSHQRGSSLAPRVQPSSKEDIPMKTIQIGADASQTTYIMRYLNTKLKLVLVTFLWANVDVFAWQPSQMPGIPREVIEHHLKIYPDVRPVQQKPRKQSIKRQNFIGEEIKKLLDVGFIRDVHHPRWLANPVVIRKAGGKLRMCIDYTSLNKVCPKDPFSLP